MNEVNNSTGKNLVNYVAATLGSVTKKEITALYKKFGIPKENQVNVQDLHITIFKSEKPFEFDGDQEDLLEALDFIETQVDFWNPEGNKMVLKVKSQFCDDIFESLNEDNQFVHEDYISHITFARNLTEEQIKNLPERNEVIKLENYPIITSVFSELR